MTELLRVGMIGCGNVVSYGHRPALTSLPHVELVALADVTEARRHIGQEWFSLSDRDLYADYRAVLDRADVDAVVVTVPQQFRRQIILDAVAAGKHILSEKPIATSPAAAEEMISAAERAGLTFGMVHNYHFLPEFRDIKRLIHEGVIGDLRVMTMHWLGVIDHPGAAAYEPGWRHTLAAGGGVLTDMIHAVYLAEWFFGAPAQQVSAFVDSIEYAGRSPEIEDLALVQLAFPSGYCVIHMGWGQGTGGIDASGSKGQLHLHYKQYQAGGFNQPIQLYTVNDWVRSDHAIENMPSHGDNIARSFTRLWDDFHRAIQDKRPPIASARAGLRALEVTLGAYVSGATGRVVTLPLPPDHSVHQDGIAGMVKLDVWSESRTKRAGIFGLRG